MFSEEQGLPRRVSFVVTAVSLFSFALVVGLGWWAMSTVDESARERQTSAARMGLDESYARIPREQESATIWDDAVVRVKAKDQPWMQENLGEWMGSYFGHSQAFVLDDSNEPIHAMKGGKTASPRPAYETERATVEPLVAELRRQIEEASSESVDPTEDIAGLGVEVYALLGGAPAIVSVKPIVPSTDAFTQEAGTEYVHVAVRLLDETFASDIGDRHQLENARVVSAENGVPQNSVPIADTNGEIIAYFAWEPYRPGLSMAQKMAPTIVAAAIPIGLLLFWLTSHLWRSTNKLYVQAFHDSMTGLPNRAQFNVLLRRALEAATRLPDRVAVMMIDLDRFKLVNDSLGHLAGDELIRQTGKRLTSSIGQSGVLARLGGDEFAVILNDVTKERDAEGVAERILADMVRPFLLGAEQVFSSVSIGIATAEDARQTASDLLRNADIALYEAKSKGRARHQVFYDELSDIVLRRRSIERDLRVALESGTLIVVFQPVYEGRGDKVVGAEALLNWHHPIHGGLSTDLLMSIAEEGGMMDALGERMLEVSCHLLRETFLPWVSINLSLFQLRDAMFASEMLRTLDSAGVEPKRLQVEIKESSLMGEDPICTSNLKRLREAEIKIVLDDFGTGYSSLNFLRHYPVDKIKIDRSLTSQLSESDDCKAIAQAIASLGRSMRKTVAVDGVASEADLDLVKEIGCDEIQGVGLSKPLRLINLRVQFGYLWDHPGGDALAS